MPRESHSWAYARGRLAPFGQLVRVENGVMKGFPDTVYCLISVCGLLEMKATLQSLTIEQVLFAEQWHAAGGLCHALLRADRRWFLLDPPGMRRAYAHEEPRPVVAAREFPLKDILRHLAPVERRLPIMRQQVA